MIRKRMLWLFVTLLFGVCGPVANADPPLSPAQQAQLYEARQLHNRASELSTQGNVKEAIVAARQAVAMKRQLLGEKTADVAASLAMLGLLHKEIDDFAAAQPCLEEALAIYKEARGPRHADTAAALNNLGFLFVAMGDYAAAKPCYDEALAIKKEVFGPRHLETALMLNNFGYLYQSMGDFATAKSYNERALAIYWEVRGPKHQDTGMSFNSLGVVLKLMGDYDSAKFYYEHAYGVFNEVLGPRHPITATSLNNMGLLLEAKGDFEAGQPYLERALAIRSQVRGPKHSDTAEAHNNLGWLLYRKGDYPAARAHLERSLAIYREIVNPKHPDIALVLDNLGRVLIALKDFDAAQQNVNQALAIRKEILGPAHPRTVGSMNSLLLLAAARPDWPAAANAALEARQAIREHVSRVLPALSQSQQLQYIRNNDERRLFAALSLGLHHAEYPPLAALSAEILTNGKAVIQESLAQRAELALAASDPQLRDQVNELATTRSRLAKLAQTIPNPQEAERINKLSYTLVERERLLTAQVNAGLGRPTVEPWITLAAVRRGLGKESVLVDMARIKPSVFAANEAEKQTAPRYIAWVTFPTGDRDAQVVDLGDASKIDAAVAAYQLAMKPCQSPDAAQNPLLQLGEAEAEKKLAAPLRELAKLVLNPLLPLWRDKREIILSPDAALWLVPWGALPTGDEQYVVEKWNLHYVITARDLAIQRKKAAYQPPRIFANPDYDLAPRDAAASLARVQPGMGAIPTSGPALDQFGGGGVRSRSVSLRGGAVGRLPGTAVEAQFISPNLQKFAQDEPRTNLDKEALEGVFKRMQSPRVLVCSTHGYFLPSPGAKIDEQGNPVGDDGSGKTPAEPYNVAFENPLLRCGLMLAGCNQRDKIADDSTLDDGVLTGMEIAGTDLRGTELVVLSACETGLGDVRNGEGVAGLRQAFQLAGARAVVSTLWQIPDKQAAQLMNGFFANLAAGQPKSQALRNAQLTLIQSRREKNGAAHPLFWAAFTLTGE